MFGLDAMQSYENNSQGHLKTTPVIFDPVGYDIIENVVPDVSTHPCLKEFVFADIEHFVDAGNTLKDIVCFEG